MSDAEVAGQVGEISEIERSLGLYKIKFTTEEYTIYQVQNRSMRNAWVTLKFFDVHNIKFTPYGEAKVVPSPESAYHTYASILVKANTTLSVVKLTQQNPEITEWTYNYDYLVEKDDSPAWLQ